MFLFLFENPERSNISVFFVFQKMLFSNSVLEPYAFLWGFRFWVVFFGLCFFLEGLILGLGRQPTKLGTFDKHETS